MNKSTRKIKASICILLISTAIANGADAKNKPGAFVLANKADNNSTATILNWQITGKVTSADGEPLPGVTVLVKGTTVGATTAPDGTYSLSVPEQPSTLVFSFIGYTSQEKP